MSLMTAEALADLRALFAAGWDRYTERWERDGGPVVLYDEVGCLLFETACAWSGVPIAPVASSPREAVTTGPDHRCAGEWATLDVMKVAAHRLAADMDYDVPLQDLRLSHRKVPALPNSGFIVTNVRRVP
jgi:fatty-acid peroxygenase